MDRTLVNVASILVGGAGLLAVLIGFNIPQVDVPFVWENSFRVKQAAIEWTMTWVFTSLTLCGPVLQLGAQIWGADLPERSHHTRYYVIFSVGGLIMVALMVFVLAGFGDWVAKRYWQPRVIAFQQATFERAAFVVEHEGWAPELWDRRESIAKTGKAEWYRAENLRVAEQAVGRIEEVLEIDAHGELKQRLAALKPLFAK
jgi:hypothetical protein